MWLDKCNAKNIGMRENQFSEHWFPAPAMVTTSKDIKEWDLSPIRYKGEYLDSKDSRQCICKTDSKER